MIAERGWLRRTFSALAPRVALAVLLVFATGAIVGSRVIPYAANAQGHLVDDKSRPPSLAHPFGTDLNSRDVLARVVRGGTVSLEIALLAVTLAVTVGTAVGAIAGYAGGRTDQWLMRIVDTLIAIPRLLVVLVAVAALGQPTVGMLAGLLGLTGWLGVSRIVRGRVREVAALDFVASARALGVQPMRILLRHVLPAVVPQMLVAATIAVAGVIPMEAGLSFLGLGVKIPEPTWGTILYDAYDANFSAWWMFVFPGVAMLATVLSINVIGEHLRKALDPRLSHTG